MSQKVLVVEDDNNIAELLRLYLQKDGFEVSHAADGGKAVEMAKEIQPDLVLLDIMLPVMDGWQVCRELRKTMKMPIIMLTAKGETEDKVSGLEMGADDYIVKPFEVKELLARVHAVLRRTGDDGKPKSKKLTFDKLVIPIALVGGLIRLGNLMNSEIYGGYTDLPWGFVFVRAGETMPAHPTQIYEALCYFALFALLMWMYWKKNCEERPWLITGVFFIGIFLPRFLIEYIKNVQEPWELAMRAQYGIDQGQLLSIPFILLGVGLVIYAMCRPRQHWTFPNRFPEEDKQAGKKAARSK